MDQSELIARRDLFIARNESAKLETRIEELETLLRWALTDQHARETENADGNLDLIEAIENALGEEVE